MEGKESEENYAEETQEMGEIVEGTMKTQP